MRGREARMHVRTISAWGTHGDVAIGAVDREGMWVAGGDHRRKIRRGGGRCAGVGLGERLAVLKVRWSGWYTVDVDAVASTYLVEVGEGEALDMALEESVAEGKLVLYVLGVTPESEGLSVPIFLLARNTCGRTGGTLWML